MYEIKEEGICYHIKILSSWPFSHLKSPSLGCTRCWAFWCTTSHIILGNNPTVLGKMSYRATIITCDSWIFLSTLSHIVSFPSALKTFNIRFTHFTMSFTTLLTHVIGGLTDLTRLELVEVLLSLFWKRFYLLNPLFLFHSNFFWNFWLDPPPWSCFSSMTPNFCFLLPFSLAVNF